MISARPAKPLGRVATGAALVVAGSGLMYLSAQVAVPILPVPVTLQTLAIPILVALLGRELGTLAVLAYLAEGAAGLPVFSGHSGGLASFIGPLATTGGYLIGFPIAAFVIGTFYHDGFYRGYFHRLIAILTGTGLVLLSGTLWLALTFTHDLGAAIAVGVTPFLVGEAAKSIVAAAVPPRAFRSAT
jgi:biotin transport system substrate-specific component